MATYPIVCPCGYLLGSTIKHGAGTKRCTSCKRNVRYKEKDGKIEFNIQKNYNIFQTLIWNLKEQ